MSQQNMFERSQTENATMPVQRSSTDNTIGKIVDSPVGGMSDPKLPLEPPMRSETALSSTTAKEKKKGVSFLSRFIGGNKKKAATFGVPGHAGNASINGGSGFFNASSLANEAASEYSESRPDGIDAALFSQPIVDNMGFSPRHPQPPEYIKVRARFKKKRDFDRLFPAQELRGSGSVSARTSVGGTTSKRSSTVEVGAPSVTGSTMPSPGLYRTGGSDQIWAMEFSKDGKYLAAGGQDKLVRVWAVISSPQERRAHEKAEEAETGLSEGRGLRLKAPVFQKKTFRVYEGHEGKILDLSWSKNNFLLSSSLDKTVRLWHVSRPECLCTFKHSEFVPSIQFHPRDDRFFLAGSFDYKLRLWSIPDKSVAFWNQLPESITAVSFTPDGKTAIAGTMGGLCMFYDTEGLKYQTQIHVRSRQGKNARGSRITGIQAMNYPPNSTNGDVKLLISSMDSRIRLYNMRDKSLEIKFRGHENNQSQIRASFSDDARYVISSSEDGQTFLWSTGPPEGADKRGQQPVEMFEAHKGPLTAAILAPTQTRQLLSTSEDPIFDLCNPPPVTLLSRAESVVSSKAAPEEVGTSGFESAQATPAESTTFKRASPPPHYVARSAHPDGHILVTADSAGIIKAFRQDCAFPKRGSAADVWDSARFGQGHHRSLLAGRTNSIKSTSVRSGRSRTDSVGTTSTQPPQDRILSWRQGIASAGSFDWAPGSPASAAAVARGKGGTRSVSPRKSIGQLSVASEGSKAATRINSITGSAGMPPPTAKSGSGAIGTISGTAVSAGPAAGSTTTGTATTAANTPQLGSATEPSSPPSSAHKPSTESARKADATISSPSKSAAGRATAAAVAARSNPDNPLMIANGGQSYMTWAKGAWREPFDWRRSSRSRSRSSGLLGVDAEAEPRLDKKPSVVSALSSEVEGDSMGAEEDGASGASGGRRGRGKPGEEAMEVKCGSCGSGEFKARMVKGVGHQLVCSKCGMAA
ncbi:WD40-repeat-containing domain protein [Lineolata rhizophorae]|uniref:WD40-repeat-containing domain protein n=1 Tax=Lineolata rhizophorae TaxID=578093 RepID=A0A6A6NN93_9PEZI|nr:WD40-repeat-containing domain protein [Lineolata rhizophorae]